MASRSTSLTPEQAMYVVDRLVAERRISSSQIERISSEMDSEIRNLEERLARLRGEAIDQGRGIVRSGRKVQSAATRASRRLQGQYLNLIRRVPAAQRDRFKKIAESKGREEAIKALRKVVNSKVG